MQPPFHVLLVPLIAAVLAAPAGFTLSNMSETDPAGVYVILGTTDGLNDLLYHPNVREIGPYRAPFARMVTATPEFHTSLVDRGYWLFPAAAVAEFCGIVF